MGLFEHLERWLDRRSDGVRQKARGQTPGLSIAGADAPRPSDARRRVRADRADHLEPSSPLAFMFEEPGPLPRMPALPVEPSEPGTEFAFALYGALRDRPGNLCFSPLSIRALLSLVCEAARGETATQTRAVLRLPEQGYLPLALIGGVQARLSATGVLSMANALWVDPRVSLLPEYVETLQGAVDCTIATADFSGDPHNAAGRINGWVRERTKGRVSHIIESSDFDAETRLVLANAVVFQDEWDDRFREDSTHDADFHLSGGGVVTAPLMAKQRTARYFETDGLQGLLLPYRRSSLSMAILLPRRFDGLAALEAELSPEDLRRWLRTAELRRVSLRLPRFSIEPQPIDWTGTLKSLGLTLVFSDDADLSGINGLTPPDREALRVASLEHRARVEVNEAGTTAVAAARVIVEAVGAPLNPPPPVEFRADRPFVFVIRDDHTGAILFMGRVLNPRE